MEEKKINKLIHVGLIQIQGKGRVLLFLRQITPQQYIWFQEEKPGVEIETPVQAETIEEALRLAVKAWKKDGYRNINCGFRYTLPERDEHGTNALFHQMAASYNSMNGIYFDEELGNNCIVHNASQEARNLLRTVK